jgi:hypothetical protein
VENPSSGNFNRFLLPNIFQVVGLVLTAAGLSMTYLRFGAGYKPGFMDVKVFAFWSTYFDTKYFQVINNNVGEEVCGITTLLGVFLFAFAREKDEKDHYWGYRMKAFILTAYCSVIFLLASFLFIYGLAFFNMLILYIILPMVLYAIFFRYYLFKERYRSRS